MLEIIIAGGMLMIPLMIESLLAVAILIDRALAFRAYARIDNRSLLSQVMSLLGQGKIQQAAQLCAATPGPVSAVLLAGLQAYDKHKPVAQSPESLRMLVEDAMSSYSSQALAAVEKRLNWLSFIGNSAPLFGMTGTVTGMIKSFNAIAGAGQLSGSVVAAGIAEALITTAAGLLIAMLAVIPYHYFSSRVTAIEMEIQDSASALLDFITLHQARQSVAPAGSAPAPGTSTVPGSGMPLPGLLDRPGPSAVV